MTIGRICSRIVHVAQPAERVIDVARRMRHANVGTVVVVDAKRRPVGILTDRDLVVRVMAEGRAPETTELATVMTKELRVVAVDTSLEDTLRQMREAGVRRLPVVDARGELLGIVSVDDIVELLAGEIGNVGRILAQASAATTAAMIRLDAPRATSGIERAQGEAEC